MAFAMTIFCRLRRKRKYILCFHGLDGSGKSTQIMLLSKYLGSQGYKVAIAKVGTCHLLAKLLERIFVYLGYYVWRPSTQCKLQKRIPKELLCKSRVMRILWALTNFLSSLVAIKVLVDFSLLYSDIVLVEDYIPRIIADFKYALENHIKSYNIFITIFLRMISQFNAKYIHLTADYEELKRRRGICMESYDYLDIQQYIYSIVDTISKSIVIDTKEDINCTFSKVIRSLSTF